MGFVVKRDKIEKKISYIWKIEKKVLNLQIIRYYSTSKYK